RVVGMMIPGAYRLRDYRYAITAVLTNKCPSGPYRAPMLICSWVTEGTVDAVARALGLDSVDVRRRNMIADKDLPYRTATELTVPIEKIRVQSGDTAAAPYGMGTRGSRGGVVSAGAALGAARVVKAKLLKIAAHLLEAPLGDLELAEGRVSVRGAPASSFTI